MRAFVSSLLLSLVASTLLASPARTQSKYDTGASDTEITIGNTMPYSGPASPYGTIGLVMSAYFDKVNAEGGVNGRKIKFISYDDAFSPPKTVEQTRKLVEADEVLFVTASLGTATSVSVLKYLNGRKVPQLFIASGAARWNSPKEFPWTMGWQPSYQSEARALAHYALAKTPNSKIAVFYQFDDSGRDYVKGFKDGLGASSSLIVAEASYQVTDPTVDSQIVALKNSGADTIFMHASPKFAAQAIRKIYEIGWKPTILMASVAASVQATLEPIGPEKAAGAVTGLYLKDPTDTVWEKDAGYLDWVAFMRKWYPKGSLVDGNNVYGYSIAQTVVAVLRQCGNDLTRENIMKQAASLHDFELPMLLPGIRLNTSATDFSPIKDFRLAEFNGTSWTLIDGANQGH